MRRNCLQLEKHKPLFGLMAALVCSSALIPSEVVAAQLPSCSGLAAGLLAGEGVSVATSAVQLAAGGHLSYCLVNITVSELAGQKDGYLPGQKQMINIGIGLPLSPADGGTGGSVGAWNKRIQDLGGGGYAGSVGPVTPATDARYVGSSTDTGHPASAGGTFALNPDNTLNLGLIRDFAFNGIHQQAVWTKKLTAMYYGEGRNSPIGTAARRAVVKVINRHRNIPTTLTEFLLVLPLSIGTASFQQSNGVRSS